MKSAFGTPHLVTSTDAMKASLITSKLGRVESRSEIFDILGGDSSVRAEELDSLKGGEYNASSASELLIVQQGCSDVARLRRLVGVGNCKQKG